MNQSNDGNILFLGDDNSPSLKWLKSIGESVIHTADNIESTLIKTENIIFLISYGYRYIIHKNILDQLPSRAINLHISYLPWNKGADPNLWSFVDDTPKGVSIHYLDAGIDTGDIIVQQEVQFDTPQETLATTYQQLQMTIQNLFQQNWQSIKTESCPRHPQQGKGSFHKLKDKESLSHWLPNDWNTSVSLLQESIPRSADTAKLGTKSNRGK